MKTMALSHGDLVIGSSADYAMTTGAPKVRQDLRAALLEPLGNDRFHPGWGSGLQDYVGLPSTEFRQAAVLGEVNRVIGNYAAVQRDRVQADVLGDTATRYSTDEILAGVTGVDVKATLDHFGINITVATAAGSKVTIEETLS